MGEARRRETTKDKEYDKELKDTFPASDPPSASQPGGGITGTEPLPQGTKTEHKAPRKE
jgi:hypothetical protein